MDTINVGDYLQERLFTDTLVYRVTKTTEHTISIVKCKRGSLIHNDFRIGKDNYPVTYYSAEEGDENRSFTLRRRKDGTFRVFTDGHALRPAIEVNGVRCITVDYRQ